MKRLNMITLGVSSLSESRAFYESLFGWKPMGEDVENIVFYNMGGYILSLFPWEKLAEDSKQTPEGDGFRGVTLAHNACSEEEVDAVFKKALAVGASQVKEPQKVFWGGYSGYIKDLDGHLWEVAYNPFTKTADDGFLDIPRD